MSRATRSAASDGTSAVRYYILKCTIAVPNVFAFGGYNVLVMKGGHYTIDSTILTNMADRTNGQLGRNSVTLSEHLIPNSEESTVQYYTQSEDKMLVDSYNTDSEYQNIGDSSDNVREYKSIIHNLRNNSERSQIRTETFSSKSSTEEVAKREINSEQYPVAFEIDVTNTTERSIMPERTKHNLQQAFLHFRKKKQVEIRLARHRDEFKAEANSCPERLEALREKMIEQAKKYFGVPYARKYWASDTPEHESPLFLDCCGLVRQVLRDLQEDLGFRLGPWNQAYMFDTLPTSLTKEQMRPGDLVFMSGVYVRPHSKKQLHDMVHVEIWLGEGDKTIGSRWNSGKVQVFDSYMFSPKSFHSEQYIFKSVDTWLKGICHSHCPEHPWRMKKFKASSKSIFADDSGVADQNADLDSDDDSRNEKTQNQKNWMDTETHIQSLVTIRNEKNDEKNDRGSPLTVNGTILESHFKSRESSSSTVEHRDDLQRLKRWSFTQKCGNKLRNNPNAICDAAVKTIDAPTVGGERKSHIPILQNADFVETGQAREGCANTGMRSKNQSLSKSATCLHFGNCSSQDLIQGGHEVGMAVTSQDLIQSGHEVGKAVSSRDLIQSGHEVERIVSSQDLIQSGHEVGKTVSSQDLIQSGHEVGKAVSSQDLIQSGQEVGKAVSSQDLIQSGHEVGKAVSSRDLIQSGHEVERIVSSQHLVQSGHEVGKAVSYQDLIQSGHEVRRIVSFESMTATKIASLEKKPRDTIVFGKRTSRKLLTRSSNRKPLQCVDDLSISGKRDKVNLGFNIINGDSAVHHCDDNNNGGLLNDGWGTSQFLRLSRSVRDSGKSPTARHGTALVGRNDVNSRSYSLGSSGSGVETRLSREVEEVASCPEIAPKLESCIGDTFTTTTSAPKLESRIRDTFTTTTIAPKLESCIGDTFTTTTSILKLESRIRDTFTTTTSAPKLESRMFAEGEDQTHLHKEMVTLSLTGSTADASTNNNSNNTEGNASTNNNSNNMEGNASSNNNSSNTGGNASTNNNSSNTGGNASTNNNSNNMGGNASCNNNSSNMEDNASCNNSSSNTEGNASSKSNTEGNASSNNNNSNNMEGNASTNNNSNNMEGNASTNNNSNNTEGNASSNSSSNTEGNASSKSNTEGNASSKSNTEGNASTNNNSRNTEGNASCNNNNNNSRNMEDNASCNNNSNNNPQDNASCNNNSSNNPEDIASCNKNNSRNMEDNASCNNNSSNNPEDNASCNNNSSNNPEDNASCNNNNNNSRNMEDNASCNNNSSNNPEDNASCNNNNSINNMEGNASCNNNNSSNTEDDITGNANNNSSNNWRSDIADTNVDGNDTQPLPRGEPQRNSLTVPLNTSRQAWIPWSAHPDEAPVSLRDACGDMQDPSSRVAQYVLSQWPRRCDETGKSASAFYSCPKSCNVLLQLSSSDVTSTVAVTEEAASLCGDSGGQSQDNCLRQEFDNGSQRTITQPKSSDRSYAHVVVENQGRKFEELVRRDTGFTPVCCVDNLNECTVDATAGQCSEGANLTCFVKDTTISDGEEDDDINDSQGGDDDDDDLLQYYGPDNPEEAIMLQKMTRFQDDEDYDALSDSMKSSLELAVNTSQKTDVCPEGGSKVSQKSAGQDGHNMQRNGGQEREGEGDNILKRGGGDTNEEDDDSASKKASKQSKFLQWCFPSNMQPTFFVGGANGTSLIQGPLLALGWRRTSEKLDENYTLKWVENKSRINYLTFREGEQLVNHIPNCKLLTNKLGLLCSLQEYERKTLLFKGRLPRLKMADFVPETYKLDDKMDRDKFNLEYKEGETWICKPIGMNQGKGIFLLRSRKQINELLFERSSRYNPKTMSTAPMLKIVQRYISHPLLVDGRKFDIRAYMFIASTVPFLVLYHKGYIRLSCQKYNHEDSNLTTHLTNQFVQKKDPLYKDVKEDTAWTMDKLNDYINRTVAKEKGLEADWVYGPLTKQMQRITLHCFNSVKHRLHCKMGYFDLYGMDFMVDADMKVWLIEINANPALHVNCQALKEAIPPVIEDALYLAIECFEKSCKGQPLMPLNALGGYSVLYCGNSPNSLAHQQIRSVSPFKDITIWTRPSGTAKSERRQSPPQNLPRMLTSQTGSGQAVASTQGTSLKPDKRCILCSTLPVINIGMSLIPQPSLAGGFSNHQPHKHEQRSSQPQQPSLAQPQQQTKRTSVTEEEQKYRMKHSTYVVDKARDMIHRGN